MAVGPPWARAERMADTRQRIVAAAYELHATVGPARTTISAVAERAGVQRHTVYQYFPDEFALGADCTRYGMLRDPQPDPARLARIADPEARLRAALGEQYAYYRRNARLLANVLRDQPVILERLREAGLDEAATPPTVRAFFEQPGRLQAALGRGWGVRGARRARLRAVLGLAIAFGTWRTLVQEQGLTDDQAVELMRQLVRCAAAHGRARPGSEGEYGSPAPPSITTAW
jgi:AcrR family transcriptional regulator